MVLATSGHLSIEYQVSGCTRLAGLAWLARLVGQASWQSKRVRRAGEVERAGGTCEAIRLEARATGESSPA